jgi:hypothetical protein
MNGFPFLCLLLLSLFACGTTPPSPGVSVCELSAHPTAYFGRQVELTAEVQSDVHESIIVDHSCERYFLFFTRSDSPVTGDFQFYHAVHDSIGNPGRIVRFSALGLLQEVPNSSGLAFAVAKFKTVDLIEDGRVTQYFPN